MTEPQGLTDLPHLKLLDDAILELGLKKVGLRALRRRARGLGQCFVISRRIYVTPQQLAAILESYREDPIPSFLPPLVRRRCLTSAELARVERARNLLIEDLRRK